MRLRYLAAIVSIVILLTATAFVPVKADIAYSAASMLTSYYNDISLRQFSTAYALWIKPPQTYENFVAGYADTDHVTPYLGDYQEVDGASGYVPGVLVGYRADGNIVSYHGCFSVIRSNASVFGWSLTEASFDLLSNDLPDNDLILAYLNLDCRSSVLVFPTVAPTPTSDPYSMSGKAYSTLTTYYQLINKKEFAAAYALWLHPLPGPKPNGAPGADYRLPFNDFVAGYTTTKFINVYPGIYNEQGGSAGHGYLNGEFPVLLISEKTDGLFEGYVGCYVMGGMQDIPFGIVSGYFKQISNAQDIPRLKDNLPALKTICDDVAANLKF